jgi:uncharacterized phiE125 gp8 family phage protein
MAWKVTAPPAEEPITLTEAKLHLRVDHADDDTLITSQIKTAREYCEDFQNRAFITQTIKLTLDEFPDVICVPRPPLISVTSIKYIDENGQQQTLNSSVYKVDTESEPARIVPAYNQCWPGLRGDINSVEVIYQAGYGGAAAVPGKVISAMKLLLTHLYENREPVNIGNIVTELPMSVKSLLSLDRSGMV